MNVSATRPLVAGPVALALVAVLLSPAQAATFSLASDFSYTENGTENGQILRANAGDLPVDAHMLIALCAPRPTFISYGVPEKGDAHWLDQQGSFMATIAAQPAFRLLGARDLGCSDDYMKEKMPPAGTDLLDGELAWRQHDGGHTDMPNIPHFIKWMEKLWSEKSDGAANVSTKSSTRGTGTRVQ